MPFATAECPMALDVPTTTKEVIMSSDTIYTTKERIPYFYIIQHKETKKLYAGSKWSKKANPLTFMKPGGYLTSSNTIRQIIKTEGIDIFDILRIDTNCDNLHVSVYETAFLQVNNCANSEYWYNKHNNTISSNTYREKIKSILIEKYGVDSPLKSHAIREKIKKTNLEKYGVDYPLKNSEVIGKRMHTMMEKYGTTHALQVAECKESFKNTCKQNHGVDYPTQNPIIYNKIKNTWKSKYGVDNPMYCEESVRKMEHTNLERYGCKNPFQNELIKDKIKATNLEKYGVINPIHNENIKEAVKQTTIKRYGVDNIGKLQVTCPYCNKTGGRAGMMMHHFENCKLSPSYVYKKYFFINNGNIEKRVLDGSILPDGWTIGRCKR